MATPSGDIQWEVENAVRVLAYGLGKMFTGMLGASVDYAWQHDARDNSIHIILNKSGFPMAATPESKVKKAVRALLDAHGLKYTMAVTGGFGNSGDPDFIVNAWGRYVGIECKANGGKPTALQERELQKIRDGGGYALVIDENNLEVLAITLAACKGHYEREHNTADSN